MAAEDGARAEIRRPSGCRTGERTLVAALAAVVVGVAVLREGSRGGALSLRHHAAQGGASTATMLAGGALGLAGGLGGFGADLLWPAGDPGRQAVPGHPAGLITLLAAGMAAQAALILQNGGFITRAGWRRAVELLLASSLMTAMTGRVLHTLIGYVQESRRGTASGLWLATIVLDAGADAFGGRPRRTARRLKTA